VTDQLTIQRLEQMAAALQSDMASLSLAEQSHATSSCHFQQVPL
jgi:hypothetical protein